MSVFDLSPGETQLDRTREAMRRSANWIAGHADLDVLALYDTRGATEEAYWRHAWLFCARIVFNLTEADMARAMTEALVGLGLRDGDQPEVHHDTIANACHHIEDLIDTDADAREFFEWLCEDIGEHFARNRVFRARLDVARRKLRESRKRDRART